MRERNSGQAVEQGVERGQKSELRAGGRGGVNVNEPEQEERSRGADGQDGRDGGAGI